VLKRATLYPLVRVTEAVLRPFVCLARTSQRLHLVDSSVHQGQQPQLSTAAVAVALALTA
jgi:hypothetical protein